MSNESIHFNTVFGVVRRNVGSIVNLPASQITYDQNLRDDLGFKGPGIRGLFVRVCEELFDDHDVHVSLTETQILKAKTVGDFTILIYEDIKS